MLDDETPDLINRDGDRGILEKKRPCALSFIAIMVAFIALGLAIFPSQILEIEDNSARRDVLSEKKDNGVTLKIKNISLSFGSKKNAESEPERAEPVSDDARILKICTLAAAATGVLGLMLAIFANHTEKQGSLNMSAAGICILAISWQYVLVGISLGIAVAIIFLLLRHGIV